MSENPGPSRIAAQGDRLIDRLGSEEALLACVTGSADPVTRATALRALVAVATGRSTPKGDETFAELLEVLALGAAEPSEVREASIEGLPFISMERAEAVLPSLLEDARWRGKAVDLLEATEFLRRAGRSRPSADFISFLTGIVVDLVGDPTIAPDHRRRADALLRMRSERRPDHPGGEGPACG